MLKSSSFSAPHLHCPLHKSVTLAFGRNNGIDYMELRLWIGIHSCLQCLVLVATDASYIIKYMTRFTEEGFSSLISFIFISDAIKKMAGSFRYYPINTGFKPDYITTYKCECLAPDPSEFPSQGGAGWGVRLQLASARQRWREQLTSIIPESDRELQTALSGNTDFCN